MMRDAQPGANNEDGLASQGDPARSLQAVSTVRDTACFFLFLLLPSSVFSFLFRASVCIYRRSSARCDSTITRVVWRVNLRLYWDVGTVSCESIRNELGQWGMCMSKVISFNSNGICWNLHSIVTQKDVIKKNAGVRSQNSTYVELDSEPGECKHLVK